MNALKWITTEAKKLKKQYPKRFSTWKEYVAQASAIYASKHKGKSPVGKKKKIGYTKARWDFEKGITKELKAAPKTLFPLTHKQKLIEAGKKFFDKKFKDIHKNENLSGMKKKAAAKKKAAPKKKAAAKSYHKDTKSHNVNIKVMSGLGSEKSKTLLSWLAVYGRLQSQLLTAKTAAEKRYIQKEIKIAKSIIDKLKK